MSATTFISVAQKHLTDSLLLLEQKRFDNAAYLSGYVVESCLKALLDIDGMPSVKELGHELPLMAGNALMLGYEKENTTTLALAESRVKGARAAYEQIVVAMILDGTN